MKKITVSSPGKLMLFGEHAVVYGEPCLVTAVDQRMTATLELIKEDFFELDAPDVDVNGYKKHISELGLGNIPKGAKFVEMAVANFFIRHPEHSEGSLANPDLIGADARFGIKITTKSEFNSKFGFGSSSASTVCTIFALSQLTGRDLSLKQIFDLSYKTVLDIQGKGSGFDVAAAVFGGTIHFLSGGKLIENIDVPNLSLIVGYTGIKADTVTIVNQVLKRAEKYPEIVEGIYDQIFFIVELAKDALEKGDFENCGELMNINQGFLSSLGVSSTILDQMINAARDCGAYGAKISGAGGGDCMIALAPPSKVSSIEKAIEKAGGQIIHIKTNAKGVRVEHQEGTSNYL